MKVTLNWLKQYVDFNWSADELAEKLTMLGLEVEGVEKLGGGFEGVVVAQVITREKHPKADKLTVCRVNDGQGERQIVCGAQNFQAGDKVPLILPGHSLPAKPGETPFVIKVGKIRGVESRGMMCSPPELGLPGAAEGLLILPVEARVGQPFAEFLGQDGSDVVYDLEVTPNRPDLNSVIGIAREISALTGQALKIPSVDIAPAPALTAAETGACLAADCSALVAVRIEDADLCPRYVARVVQGVKVGPSPAWLSRTLEKVGLRSISNVVDVTNYVMLECGQPLHAFDYHLVARAADGKPTIVVRRAAAQEVFVTLDGQSHTLTPEMLLIADESKGIALAGVMGGQNSEINEQTVDVLIESAYFKPSNIRRTSKALGLRTDASYRFERGADIGMTAWASLRCAQLVLQTAGGTLAEGVVDAFPQPALPRQVTLRHARTNQLLGLEIPADQQDDYLKKLGLEAVARQAEATVFDIPTFRVDLKRETDLIEEVARLYGVDRIPSTPPRGAIGANAYDAVHDQLAEVRRILAGLGLHEAQGQTLVGDAAAKLVVGGPAILLSNPLSADMNTLRPSLLPGLLDSLRHNLSHKVNDVALFELGRVFASVNGQTREERRLALALTGQRTATFWKESDREARFDIFDLKGLVEGFLEQFGVRGVTYLRRERPTALFLESASIQLGGKVPLGELGLVAPLVAKGYDLRDPVLLAELHLDQLLARRNADRVFRALPQFPSIRRDLAMLVPEDVTHEAVLAAVKRAQLQHLERVELFDVFRGRNVPAGQKSMAYAFIYRHADRTLTDGEVNTAHERLVGQLRQSLGAVVREA